MLSALKPDDAIKLLVFGPAQRLLDRVLPATLLAILDRDWILAIGAEASQPEVSRCGFANTLFVEMTEVLLYGLLRIDFTGDGRARSVAIQFNTVMEDLYQEAVQILLNGIEGGSYFVPRSNDNLYAALRVLPLKFQNAIVKHLPIGQQVLGFVHWPTILGRRLKIFRRELAPAGALVLTNRQLLFISEEKAWSRRLSDVGYKYGYIVTYCPLARVEFVELIEHDSLDAVGAKVRTHELGEKLEIKFPCERKAAISAFVKLVSLPQLSSERGRRASYVAGPSRGGSLPPAPPQHSALGIVRVGFHRSGSA
jgi:hypothetical protein